MRNIARLLALTMIAGPAFSPAAQKKDDLVSIQRDIADLVDNLKALRKSQDEKMQALKDLVQQSVDASSKTASSFTSLQSDLMKNVGGALAELQNKIAGQQTETGSKLDALSSNMNALNESMSQLSQRVADTNSKLNDIRELVKSLNAPPPAAPPAPVLQQSSATGAPPGWSASVAYNEARSDYGSGKLDLAIKGFLDYIKYSPRDDENAPNAQFYIGQSYMNLKQYEDAALAFADVDKYPPNPKTCEARYMKAVALQNTEKKSDSLSAYHEFMDRCPGDTNRENAQKHIRELSPAPRGAQKGTKGKK